MSIDNVQRGLVIYLAFTTPSIWYLSGYIVSYYAEPSIPLHTFRTIRMGIYCALAMVMLLPIDLAAVVTDRGRYLDPNGQNYERDGRSISVFYGLFYIVILLWGSVVLCYQEYLNTDGYFTPRTRIWSALRRMLWDYVPIIGLGVPALLIMLKVKLLPSNIAGLKLFTQLATNTGYTVVVAFLMGFGLVEFPRLLWSKSDIAGQLLKAQMKAATEFAASLEARNALSMEVSSVLKTKDAIGSDPLLVEAMGIMTSECPSEFRSSKYGELANDKNGKITIHTLAQLRTRMNEKKSVYRMAQARLEATQMGAYNLEDMVLAMNSGKKVIFWSLRNADSTEAEYVWMVTTLPKIYKRLSIFCSFMSLFSFLGIISSMGSQNASVYFHVVHYRSTSETGTLMGVVIFVFITLSYVMLVTLWALFQLRALFELIPLRTTPAALSFATRVIGMLTFPICFFYLGWLGENGIIDGPWMYYSVPLNITTDVLDSNGLVIGTTMKMGNLYMPTALTSFYPMASVPTIKHSYGILYPILLFVFLILILSKAYNRLVVALKSPHLQFGDPIIAQEALDEGMKQLQRFRKIAERTVQRAELTAKRLGEKAGSYPGLKFCGCWIFKPYKKPSPIIKKFVSGGANAKIPPPAGLYGSAHFKTAVRGRLKLKWVEIFVIVKEPGILVFAETEEAAEKNLVAPFLPSPLDLALVLDFATVFKDDKEGYRLKIELVAESIKIRFDSEDEVNRWKRGLSEWKEYSATCESILRDSKKRTEASSPSSPKDIEEGGGSSIELVNMNSTKNPLLDDVATDLTVITPVKSKTFVVTDVYKHVPEVLKSPPPLEGFLFKKRNSALVKVPTLSKFQERYFRVDEESGMLHYFKDNCHGVDIPMGSLRLAAINEVATFMKEDKSDPTRFNISSSGIDKVYKLKASDIDDRKMWVEGLNAWREFFILRYGFQQAAIHSPQKVTPPVSPKALEKVKELNVQDLGEDNISAVVASEEEDNEEDKDADDSYEDDDDVEGEDDQADKGHEEVKVSSSDTNELEIEVERELTYDSYQSAFGRDEDEIAGYSLNENDSDAKSNTFREDFNPMMITNPLIRSPMSAVHTNPPPKNMGIAQEEVRGGEVADDDKDDDEDENDVVDEEEEERDTNDEDAYIRSMEKKYSKVAPRSATVPLNTTNNAAAKSKFIMPVFSMGKTKN